MTFVARGERKAAARLETRFSLYDPFSIKQKGTRKQNTIIRRIGEKEGEWRGKKARKHHRQDTPVRAIEVRHTVTNQSCKKRGGELKVTDRAFK
jgi:hypothetical protein